MTERIRATLDADGWIKGIIRQEINEDLVAELPPLRTDQVLLATAPPRLLGGLLRYVNGQVGTPHDDRIAWRRLRQRGVSGPDAVGLLSIRSLEGLPDAGVVAVPVAPRGGFTYAYPDVPGLTVRPLNVDDLQAMADGAVEAGIYEATCPDPEHPCCRPPEAHAWLRLATRIDRDDTWQLAWELDGTPLQMELILVEQTQGFRLGQSALFSYTAHFNRERPHWFWRELERPVFERLQKVGVSTIYSRTRADRPDWIQALIDNYDAVDTGVGWDDDGATVRLEWTPEKALAKMTGWPARRTGGPAWSWEQGAIRVWEGTEADLPAVDALIDQIGSPAQRAFVRSRLTQWWRLDRATLLLASAGGQLESARLVRHRRGGKSSLFTLSPLDTRRLGQGPVTLQGVREWHRQVGYDTITYFTPSTLRASNEALRAVGAREVAQHTKFRTEMTEWEIDA